MSQEEMEKYYHKFYPYIVEKAEELTSNPLEQEELIAKGLLALVEALNKNNANNIYSYISRALQPEEKENIIPDMYLEMINSGLLPSEKDDSLNAIEKQIIDREDLEYIYKFIADLSSKNRFILLSYYGLGGYPELSVPEIAKRCNCSVSNIYALLLKIKLKLKSRYIYTLNNPKKAKTSEKINYIDYLLFHSNLTKINWPEYLDFITKDVKMYTLKEEEKEELFSIGLSALIKISRSRYQYPASEIKRLIFLAIEDRYHVIVQKRLPKSRKM